MKFIRPVIFLTQLGALAGLVLLGMSATRAQEQSPAVPLINESASVSTLPYKTESSALEPAEVAEAADSFEEPEPAPDHASAPLADQLVPRVSVGGDVSVHAEESVEAAVAVFGDVSVNGRAENAVAVLGNVTVNGEVVGNVVAVLGGVELGPRAVVHGEIVTIGGGLEKASGAVVKRGSQEIGAFSGPLPQLQGLRAWFRECALLGRPLAWGEQLGWAWLVAGVALGFYVLLALVFGRAVEKCADTFEQRPGRVVLVSLLTLLLTPVVTLLLSITVIGPVLVLLALVLSTLFGRAAMLVLLGRRVGPRAPALAVLVGGVLVTLLYIVPVLGFIVWAGLGMLGLGTVVTALFREEKRTKPAPPVFNQRGAVPPMPSSMAPPNTDFAAPLEIGNPAPEPTQSQRQSATEGAVMATAATLPRAGFWIRIAASLIDVILIGGVTSLALDLLPDIIRPESPPPAPLDRHLLRLPLGAPGRHHRRHHLRAEGRAARRASARLDHRDRKVAGRVFIVIRRWPRVHLGRF